MGLGGLSDPRSSVSALVLMLNPRTPHAAHPKALGKLGRVRERFPRTLFHSFPALAAVPSPARAGCLLMRTELRAAALRARQPHTPKTTSKHCHSRPPAPAGCRCPRPAGWAVPGCACGYRRERGGDSARWHAWHGVWHGQVAAREGHGVVRDTESVCIAGLCGTRGCAGHGECLYPRPVRDKEGVCTPERSHRTRTRLRGVQPVRAGLGDTATDTRRCCTRCLGARDIPGRALWSPCRVSPAVGHTGDICGQHGTGHRSVSPGAKRGHFRWHEWHLPALHSLSSWLERSGMTLSYRGDTNDRGTAVAMQHLAAEDTPVGTDDCPRGWGPRTSSPTSSQPWGELISSCSGAALTPGQAPGREATALVL